MQDARALFNQYSSETPPADFTEELKEQYEFAFYDKEAEFKELQNHVQGLQGLKAEAEAEVARQEEEFKQHLEDAATRGPELAAALYAARAEFERARVNTLFDGDLGALEEAYWNAYHENENARWALYDLRAQEEREKAQYEDLKTVTDDITRKAGEDVTALDAFKTPLDDQIALTATKKTEWEEAKRAAEEAKDTADYPALEQEAEDKKTAYDTEEAKVGPLRDTYNEEVQKSQDAALQRNVDDIANKLWGREADADNNIEAIEGI